MNKKFIDIIEYSFFITLLLISIITSEVNFSFGYILLKIITFFTLLFLMMKSWIRNGVFSLYSLFIDFSMFFVFSRLFFDLINYIPLTTFLFFGRKTFSEGLIFTILIRNIFFLIAIDMGYYLSHSYTIREKKVNFDSNVEKILFVLYIFSAIWFGFKAILDIKTVLIYGYSAVLSDLRVDYPFWLKGAGTVFITLFYSLFLVKHTKKKWMQIIIVYLILMLLTGLRGSRASFIVPLIFAIYVMNELKVISIKLKQFVLFILLIIGFIFLITIARGENLTYIKSFKDIFYYIFYNQGNTFGLLTYYAENKQDIKVSQNLPIIISDLLSYYNKNFHTGSEIIGKYANTSTLSGIGLGQSLFLELFDMPFAFSLLLSCFIGAMIKFTEKNLLINRNCIVVFCIMSCSIFYMPRDILFAALEPLNFVYVFGSLFLFVFFKFFYNKKKLIVNN